MSEPREESDLAGKLSITTSKATRPSMLGRFQFNLATKLAISLFNPDPLQAVRHTLEAFLSLGPEEQELVEPDPEERTRHAMRYEICESLANMVPTSPEQDGTPRFCVPWSFGRVQAPDYFGIFYHMRPTERRLSYRWTGFQWEIDEGNSWSQAFWEKLQDNEEKAWRVWYQILWGDTSGGTTPAWALGIKTHFIQSVMPISEKLGRAIVEKFIEPSVWQQAMEAVHGGSGGMKGDADRRVA